MGKRGIVVSNDRFRDVLEQYENKPDYIDQITQRVLKYDFVDDDIIDIPDDPLGRDGPSLNEFLTH